MPNHKLIWWTNQGDCEAIGGALPKKMPVYLRDQYCSRIGRNGRGRLWVAEHLGAVSVDPWPETSMGRLLGGSFMSQTYAGIVIRREDVSWLAEYPGIITDLSLRRAL